MPVSIVADQGTHLLIADGDRYAVIERHEDRFYNCHSEQRAGVPATDLSAVGQVPDDSDWTAQATAEATFRDVVARGTQLARRML
jgi:hypothetical protein